MSVIYVGIGFMILIAGRPLYPVFVGGMSFLLGVYLDKQFHITQPGWNIFAVPLAVTLLGFLAGFVFRRWAAWVVGFASGAYLVYNLPLVFRAEPAWANIFTAIIVGTICVALLLIIFDAFMVFLSSLTAVTMILTNARFGRLDPIAIFMILMVFGIITQYLVYEYTRPTPD